MDDDRVPFPLGSPLGRKAESNGLTPIEGRPNWFRDKRGSEVYVEPPAKPAPVVPPLERRPI